MLELLFYGFKHTTNLKKKNLVKKQNVLKHIIFKIRFNCAYTESHGKE